MHDGKSGYHHRRAGGRDSRSLRLPLIALVVLIVVAVVVVAVVAQTQHPGSQNSEAYQGQLSVAESPFDAASQHGNKLEGAQETVDENGIVHGTTPNGIAYVVYGRGEQGADPDKVSFAAVGDQIGTGNSMPIAAAYAASSGNGDFDFTPFYREIGPIVREFDIRFINQETVMAGTDGREYSGYPSFNSPDACAEAIAYEGFNVVNFGSNHTYDMGLGGIERSHEVFNRWPEIMMVGSYASSSDRETVHMIERNGTTIAFLAYIYGDNRYMDPADFPNLYYSCPFEKDAMASEISRAQEVADAVVVYMHWGTEYVVEPNEQQWEYAQFLADLGVDLVIGSHAHIMQPVRYVEGAEGNSVPVVFGLGDFLSGWTLTDTILSGLFTCDFVWEGDDLTVQNLLWTPLIEWSDGGDVYIRALSSMTDEEIAENTRTEDVDDDVPYLHALIDSSGMEIPVAW